MIVTEIWIEILFYLPFRKAWELRHVCTSFEGILHDEVVLEKFHLISKTQNKEVALVEYICKPKFECSTLFKKRIDFVKKNTFYAEFKSYILCKLLKSVQKGWVGIHAHFRLTEYHEEFTYSTSGVFNKLRTKLHVERLRMTYSLEMREKAQAFLRRGFNFHLIITNILDELKREYGYYSRYTCVNIERDWEFILSIEKEPVNGKRKKRKRKQNMIDFGIENPHWVIVICISCIILVTLLIKNINS